MSEFKELEGKTLVAITDCKTGSERVTFLTTEGQRFYMYHAQDCCENVAIDTVYGDLEDLIGTPILLAEEAVSEDNPEDATPRYLDECHLWTFYKLRTAKGDVTIRWFGSSNGYYSVNVNFDKTATWGEQ